MFYDYRLGTGVLTTSTDASDRRPAPLFSIIWFGRNRLKSAQDCIVWAASQIRTDMEFIVADNDSRDGTLEAFRTAANGDPRIHVLPGMTTSAGEGLLYALRQCRGDYIAIWPSEGAIFADALEFAAAKFRDSPDAGGICCQGFLTDTHGNSVDDVNIITLLVSGCRPFLSCGFFSRKALLASGLNREGWLVDAIDLELCCRLATDHGLRSFPHMAVVKSRQGQPRDDGLLPRSVDRAIEDHLLLVSRIFSTEGFFGEDSGALALECKAIQLSNLRESFRELGTAESEYRIALHLLAVVRALHLLLQIDHRVLRSLHRLLCSRSHNLGLLSSPLQKLLAYTTTATGRLPIHIGYSIWRMPFFGYWLKRKIILLTRPNSEFDSSAPPKAVMFADLYAQAAARFEARGQIALAIDMWNHAGPPHNITLDSLACQALLKLPDVTDAFIVEFQRKWVDRYVGERKSTRLARAKADASRRKVRIGYHCSFMDSDTVRYMMRDAIAAHDRTKFEVYGYSPRPVPDDLKGSFDVLRDTTIAKAGPGALMMGNVPTMSDEQFVKLVRGDEIDVFVELSGFSPGHRFVAMSQRCAPVQVSFLNHTGSSHVPNVDYILSDEIGTPSNASLDNLYSERIYRLPDCFFCFDYRNSDSPQIVDSPLVSRGYVTFGCFGSGGKINLRIIEWWARLLHRIPTSILRIQNSQLDVQNTRRFMAERFQQFGIGKERLVLAWGVDRRSLLDAYNEVDISLDTWPYCGGNTVAESLWMGVPMITLKGDRFGSRYGTSLVTAAGCADLAAETPEQYVEVAARLAGDLPRLRDLRHNLRPMSLEYGLGNSERFARKLESAYAQMVAASTAEADSCAHRAPAVF